MPTVTDRNRTSLDDRLFTVRRERLKESHISVDARFCHDCLTRICTYICPAEVYVWNELENRIDVRHENCLECGACRIACEMHSIEWSNPPDGAGISYKHG